MSKTDLLEGRVRTLEGQVKKYAVIATLAGALLGSGGVFGIAQWAYKAPLDKQVLKYESARKSLDSAIQAANDSGAKKEASALRIELIRLDRNYRTALGLIEECMQILSRSEAVQGDVPTQSWLNNTADKLRQLRTQREPISELGDTESR